ncbi:molybdenum cofactor guanylyltransferase MobA [Sesbania bispinosa]|nr:molybdenum cofactor guanylyltransferase MobA [Sesbania bispinosa]
METQDVYTRTCACCCCAFISGGHEARLGAADHGWKRLGGSRSESHHLGRALTETGTNSLNARDGRRRNGSGRRLNRRQTATGRAVGFSAAN